MPEIDETSIFLFPDEPVDNRALPDGADDDQARAGTDLVCNRRRLSGDPGNVGLQIADGANHAGMIVRVHVDGCERFSFSDGEIIGMTNELHIFRLAESKASALPCEQRERGQ